MPACPLCNENQAFLETENRVRGGEDGWNFHRDLLHPRVRERVHKPLPPPPLQVKFLGMLQTSHLSPVFHADLPPPPLSLNSQASRVI